MQEVEKTMVIPFAVFDIAGYLPTGIRLGGSGVLTRRIFSSDG